MPNPPALPRLVAAVLFSGALCLLPLLGGCSDDGLSSETPAAVATAVNRQRTLRPAALQHKVVLLVTDAVDPDVVDDMRRKGLLPGFARLQREGAAGLVIGAAPHVPLTGWTSLVTGSAPEEHGVLGDTLADWYVKPGKPSSAPIPDAWRARETIFELLSRCGVSCTVVDWPGAEPQEVPAALRLVRVDDRLDAALAGERVVPADLGALEVQTLVAVDDAGVEAARDGRDERLQRLMGSLARATTVRNLTTRLLREDQPRLLAARITLVDDVCQDFLRSASPRLPGVEEDVFVRESLVVQEAYRWLDSVVAEIAEACDDRTTLLVVSPYGHRSGRTRGRRAIDFDAERPETWRRDFGYVAVVAPGLPGEDRMPGTHLQRIAPTILTLLGFPVPTDTMTTQIVEDAFADPPEPATVDTYFGNPRQAAAAAARETDRRSATPSLHLVRLGERLLARSIEERNPDLAHAALDAFLDALERRRDDRSLARVHTLAARTYLELLAHGAGEAARKEASTHVAAAVAKGALSHVAMADGAQVAYGADAADVQLVQARLALLDGEFRIAEELVRRATEAASHRIDPHLTLASLLDNNRAREASQGSDRAELLRNQTAIALEAALRAEPRSAISLRGLGRVQLTLARGDLEKLQAALGNLEQSLEVDGQNPEGLHYFHLALRLLGRALIDKGRPEEAEEAFLRALAAAEHEIWLAPDLARSHADKAQVLLELGDMEGARASAEAALGLDPAYVFDLSFTAAVLHDEFGEPASQDR